MIKREEKSFELDNEKLKLFISYLDISIQSLQHKLFRVFIESDDDLGSTLLIQHNIQTEEAAPIRQPLRSVPEAHREIMEEKVAKTLRLGVIEPGQSPWASPMVKVKKKAWLFKVHDYKRLNAVTQFDTYPCRELIRLLTV